MHLDLQTPISAAGILSIIASLGTIVSSLCTPKVLRILGTGKLVAYSIALTAMASVGYGLAERNERVTSAAHVQVLRTSFLTQQVLQRLSVL